MKSMLQQFKAARRVSTPLVAIRTPDPAATMQQIVNAYAANGNTPPIAQWDIIRGITAINEVAVATVDAMNDGGEPAMTTGNPAEALGRALKFEKGGILFFHNAQLFTTGNDDSRKPIIQGIWNLRDQFKANKRMLVMLTPQIQLPPELSNDVLVLDEALPDEGELREIVSAQFAAARFNSPDEETLRECTDAIAGLAAFPAEQVVAMSLNPQADSKIDIEDLWERKRQAIENAGGLTVYRGGSRYDNLIGIENVVKFMRMIISGKRPPKLIVLVDEIEKQMAGSQTDSSGTSQDQLGVMLKNMEDNEWSGVLLPGFPGTGKTELFKATSGEAGCVGVQLDFGGMKNSLVGESEKAIRNAMKTLLAMGGKDVFFMATCNNMDTLKPELKRRFRHGTFFFDLPGQLQVEALFKHYSKVFGIKTQSLPPDVAGWTGAEVKTCCQNAAEFGITLAESARYITPVIRSMGDQVAALRKQANGKYISASKPGVYTTTALATTGAKRDISAE